MYAIVATGGKQYKVSPGDKVRVEKLEGNVSDKVVLENVLFISDTKTIGTPYIEGASVETEITRQGKAKKVIVYKYKPKKGYHKKNGHRQLFTELEVKTITLNGEIIAEEAAEEEVQEVSAEEVSEEAEEVTGEAVEEETAEEAAEAAEEVSEEAEEEASEEEEAKEGSEEE